MAPSQALQTPDVPTPFPAPLARSTGWWRSLVLLLLLGGALPFYALLIGAKPQPPDTLNGITPFVQLWMLSFLPYFVACGFVLFTKAAVGRWRWIELAIIFAGALLLRALLLPLPPGLSHDSWRYLWDARVTLHGVSPYVYAPGDTSLRYLQDALIFGNSRFRDVPTIYPPAAQAVFLLSYLLAPSNLFFLKGIFVLFDMLTCVLLAIWLVRNGSDPRRVLLYAWCPLPIVEYALQGHLDALPIALTMLALFCATSTQRGARVLTGVLIGLATLAKIYPIVVLAVVLRRRDWALLTSCFATIIIGYVPFLILGHGQVFGFFSKYAGEQGGNAGVLQLSIFFIAHQHFGLSIKAVSILEYIIDGLFMGSTLVIVFLLRQRQRLSMEAGALILFGAVFAVSSHVFPWYTPVLLPFVILLLGSPWTRKTGFSGRGIAVYTAWYFTYVCIIGYFTGFTLDWYSYYLVAYSTVLLGLGIAACVGSWNTHRLLAQQP